MRRFPFKLYGMVLALVGCLLSAAGCSDKVPPAPPSAEAQVVDPPPSPTAEQDARLKEIVTKAARIFAATQSVAFRDVGVKRGELREVRVERLGDSVILHVDWSAVADMGQSFLSSVELNHVVFFDEFLRFANHPDQGYAWRELDQVVVTAYTGDTLSIALQTTVSAEGLHALSVCQVPGTSCGSNRPLANALWRVTVQDEIGFLAYWRDLEQSMVAAAESRERHEACPKCDRGSVLVDTGSSDTSVSDPERNDGRHGPY